MSDFRIINKRDENKDEDNGCCSNCNECGGCSSIPLSGIADDSEILFKVGDIVRSKLTGDKLMVLGVEKNTPVSYIVRTNTYETVMLLDFEIE